MRLTACHVGLQLQTTHCRHSRLLQASAGDRWTDDVPAQLFELLALIRTAAHHGVQAEAVCIGAQHCPGLLVMAGHRAQAENLLAGARTQGDAMSARGRLQRRQRLLRIRVQPVGHALLLDQTTSPRQQLYQPCDDLVEDALEFIVGGVS